MLIGTCIQVCLMSQSWDMANMYQLLTVSSHAQYSIYQRSDMIARDCSEI